MLKSLFSGISGLQSHQTAMDVESNNIANVNTTGFKYSRANFSDLLSQTKTIATAAEGALGGKNPVQVGLGTSVNSMTRIFSQGSVQSSDKNTAVMIQGDGFFVISPDEGKTYKYTRAGNFSFDAGGNFVDNNGYTVQGWMRDDETKRVDSTTPIRDIIIPPGLTTPARATAKLAVQANLNSGSSVKNYSPAYSIASTPRPNDGVITPAPSAIDKNGFKANSGDVGVMFNDNGDGFALRDKQGMWASFKSADHTLGTPDAGTDDMTLDIHVDPELKVTGNVVEIRVTKTGTSKEKADELVSAINAKTDIHGLTATADDDGEITLTNDNGDASRSHNLNVDNVSTGLTIGDVKTAYRYQYDSKAPVTTVNADKRFKTIADLREALELQARSVGDFDVPTDTTGGTATASDAAGTANEGVDVEFTLAGKTIKVNEPDSTSDTDMAKFYADAINNANIDGITAFNNGADIVIRNASSKDVILNIPAATGHNGFAAGDTTIDAATGDGTDDENNISIEVNESGQFELKNPGYSPDGDYDIDLKITAYTDQRVGQRVTKNERFSKSIEALGAVLPSGSNSKSLSQGFNAATHASSIDIFDSLGSKHTIRTEFRKTTLSVTSGSTWDMTISVPEPATINTIAPTNEKKGAIRFDNEGLYLTSTVQNISFSGNNGSAPDQQIDLDFGTTGLSDGMKSFDSESSTTNISQDGYTSGNLVGLGVDKSGTLVGTFSNNRSFGLAQISMAKFANNEGLSVEGGNNYTQTANSGDPIIGVAGTSGRGTMQSGALEASNVDLSSALTQLIIIQRGFQANGKTITTSDQLLQTLIGLKQ